MADDGESVRMWLEQLQRSYVLQPPPTVEEKLAKWEQSYGMQQKNEVVVVKSKTPAPEVKAKEYDPKGWMDAIEMPVADTITVENEVNGKVVPFTATVSSLTERQAKALWALRTRRVHTSSLRQVKDWATHLELAFSLGTEKPDPPALDIVVLQDGRSVEPLVAEPDVVLRGEGGEKAEVSPQWLGEDGRRVVELADTGHPSLKKVRRAWISKAIACHRSGEQCPPPPSEEVVTLDLPGRTFSVPRAFLSSTAQHFIRHFNKGNVDNTAAEMWFSRAQHEYETGCPTATLETVPLPGTKTEVALCWLHTSIKDAVDMVTDMGNAVTNKSVFDEAMQIFLDAEQSWEQVERCPAWSDVVSELDLIRIPPNRVVCFPSSARTKTLRSAVRALPQKLSTEAREVLYEVYEAFREGRPFDLREVAALTRSVPVVWLCSGALQTLQAAEIDGRTMRWLFQLESAWMQGKECPLPPRPQLEKTEARNMMFHCDQHQSKLDSTSNEYYFLKFLKNHRSPHELFNARIIHDWLDQPTLSPLEMVPIPGLAKTVPKLWLSEDGMQALEVLDDEIKYGVNYCPDLKNWASLVWHAWWESEECPAVPKDVVRLPSGHPLPRSFLTEHELCALECIRRRHQDPVLHDWVVGIYEHYMDRSERPTLPSDYADQREICDGVMVPWVWVKRYEKFMASAGQEPKFKLLVKRWKNLAAKAWSDAKQLPSPPGRKEVESRFVPLPGTGELVHPDFLGKPGRVVLSHLDPDSPDDLHWLELLRADYAAGLKQCKPPNHRTNWAPIVNPDTLDEDGKTLARLLGAECIDATPEIKEWVTSLEKGVPAATPLPHELTVDVCGHRVPYSAVNQRAAGILRALKNKRMELTAELKEWLVGLSPVDPPAVETMHVPRWDKEVEVWFLSINASLALRAMNSRLVKFELFNEWLDRIRVEYERGRLVCSDPPPPPRTK